MHNHCLHMPTGKKFRGVCLVCRFDDAKRYVALTAQAIDAYATGLDQAAALLR